MYGFIDKSFFETMLYTCKNIEIPPNPSKNEVNIILIEIAFICIFDINAIPLVISIIPVINGATKVGGIPMALRHGEIKETSIFKNLLALNIDIITEKRTTKPPIIIIVYIDL